MDRISIGLNAGKVWHILSDNEKWCFEKLKTKSGLNDLELAAAIGWLAREDKVSFVNEDGNDYVCLLLNVYIG